MKRLLLAFATALLIPGMLSAATLGVHFSCAPTKMACSPRPFSFFMGVIVLHPASGELRGTFAPGNEFFPITGLSSIVCPEQIGTQEESWGAIKLLYR